MEDKKELKAEELETTSGGIVVAADINGKAEKRITELRKKLANQTYRCADCHTGTTNRYEVIGVPDDERVQLRCTSCGATHYYKWEKFGIE